MADQPKTPSSSSKPMSAVDAILAKDPAADAAAAAAKPADGAPRKKKSKRSVPKAKACITATENNTLVTITDLDGKTLVWASSGSSGFKGARKSTPYAAKVAAERAMAMAEQYGIQSLEIHVRGIGPGREQAIRGLQTAGISFDAIIDTTPVPHGGCRRPKPRRV